MVSAYAEKMDPGPALIMAIIPKKSISRTVPAINQLTSNQVYDRPVTALPLKSSRDYIRRVFGRTDIYGDWHGIGVDGQSVLKGESPDDQRS